MGVGGAILLLIGPEFGLKMGQNPTAITGIGSILAYVLTQKNSFTGKNDKDDKDEPPNAPPKGGDDE